ncbi:glycosyltransferase [Synechococcales cyanobacterium C]|uniref:Glycosyltransferase n=1 Tax=Petrachloros mirabilis ULC683 TaxID=2781853 RepID=A0A8K1ZZV9_9CYAN|nr:glycosyltransferase [Petrachloros mirabilis]NCJ07171.1 glycosyltransferase [Petrachloros mirabilis ULC683]
MRKLYFLLPGTTRPFHCGGLWAELKTLRLAQQVCAAQIVTYRQREPDTLFLADLLRQPPEDVIFVASWGFDVAKLARKLRDRNLLYHAHSAGYGFRLPAAVPIMTVSRNTLGYWGQQAPHSLLYYLPNQISEEFRDQGLKRDIDVLVHPRKSSQYLMEQLVPALKSRCRVQVIDGFVEDLAALFSRSHIYLYDSAEYWAMQGVTEGFGLQPLEAMACGCQVFSSINHGLSDYLDPGFNCHKIAGYSTPFDVQRILQVLKTASPPPVSEALFQEYRLENILAKLEVILAELNLFFDYKQQHPGDIDALTRSRLWRLRGQRLWQKLKQKIANSP